MRTERSIPFRGRTVIPLKLHLHLLRRDNRSLSSRRQPNTIKYVKSILLERPQVPCTWDVGTIGMRSLHCNYTGNILKNQIWILNQKENKQNRHPWRMPAVETSVGRKTRLLECKGTKNPFRLKCTVIGSIKTTNCGLK